MVQDWPSPKKETQNDQSCVHIGQSRHTGLCGAQSNKTQQYNPSKLGLRKSWAVQSPDIWANAIIGVYTSKRSLGCLGGALGFGLTFPNPKRALGAHGVPHWGSSAPAHHTHPLAMQPAGGAHASSSSIVGGRGRGGREVHLCGAPSGLPLPWFCEWKYLQMCSGGGGGREGRGHGDTVLAIQYTLLHW